MDAARALIIICFFHLFKVDGCLSASINVEEDQDELDVDPGNNFFILRNRATNSCLDISWYNDVEKAGQGFAPVKMYPRCHSGNNQQLKLKDGRLEFYCLCLGARKLADGELIGLVPVDHEDELYWTLEDDGGLYVTNTTFRIATSGRNLILSLENSPWRLEKVRKFNNAMMNTCVNINFSHLNHCLDNICLTTKGWCIYMKIN